MGKRLSVKLLASFGHVRFRFVSNHGVKLRGLGIRLDHAAFHERLACGKVHVPFDTFAPVALQAAAHEHRPDVRLEDLQALLLPARVVGRDGRRLLFGSGARLLVGNGRTGRFGGTGQQPEGHRQRRQDSEKAAPEDCQASRLGHGGAHQDGGRERGGRGGKRSYFIIAVGRRMRDGKGIPIRTVFVRVSSKFASRLADSYWRCTAGTFGDGSFQRARCIIAGCSQGGSYPSGPHLAARVFLSDPQWPFVVPPASRVPSRRTRGVAAAEKGRSRPGQAAAPTAGAF